jgi:hypothetical protein
MSIADRTSEAGNRERLLLEAMLTLSTAMLRIHHDLSEIRSMLARPSTPTAPTTAARRSLASRGWTLVKQTRAAWELIVWAASTKWGQTVISLVMPLVMSEARWGWVRSFLRQLFGSAWPW